jgi:hypothetical protein
MAMEGVDVLLKYEDGKKLHMDFPSPVPLWLRIPDSETAPFGESIKVRHFRRDALSPDECPVFKETETYEFI